MEKINRKSKCDDCIWFSCGGECNQPDERCDYKKAELPEGYADLLMKQGEI